MKKSTFFTLSMIVVIVAAIFIWWDNIFPPADNSNTNTGIGKIYPEPGDYPTYSLNDLVADNMAGTLRPGNFNTEGYIIDIWTCPPCPEDGVCMPCPHQYAITISEENFMVSKDVQEKISIEADNLEQFNIGQKYILSISVEMETGVPVLIGYEAL